MTYNEILSAAQSLSETERQSLLQALSVGNQCEATVPESSRLSALLEKQGCCPHCGSNRYYRFGKDQGPRNATLQVQGLRQDFHRIYRHVAAEAPQERACEGIHATDVRTEVP